MKPDIIYLNTYGQVEGLADSYVDHGYDSIDVYDFYEDTFKETLAKSWDNFEVRLKSDPDHIWPVEYQGTVDLDAFDEAILNKAVSYAWMSTLKKFDSK